MSNRRIRYNDSTAISALRASIPIAYTQMTSETGLAGCRITSQRGRVTFVTAAVSDPADWRTPPASGAAGVWTRDSGSQRHANAMLSSTSAAAARPGPRGPHTRWVTDPNTAPMLTPRLVAADSQPSALARCAGAIVSATYAWATPVVPPPKPWTKRETKSSHSDPASPKMKYAAVDAASPASSAGRRPRRSDTRPHTGDATSCATGNEAVSRPIVVGLALSLSAYNASSGKTRASPLMSTNATAIRDRKSTRLNSSHGY